MIRFKFFVTILIVTFCGGLVSCGGDVKITPEELVGKWIITWREGCEKDENGIALNEWGKAPDSNRGIVFLEGGKFVAFYGDNNNWDNGIWVLTKDTIVLQSISGLKYEYKVAEFSSSRMVMELYEQGHDGYNLYDKVIYQKQ